MKSPGNCRLNLQQPEVSVLLARSVGIQQITGTYQVQPDGTVSLHGYGAVHVAGKTITEAKLAIEQHVAQYFDLPQISVDVVGYNSKSYYVIVAGPRPARTSSGFPSPATRPFWTPSRSFKG